MKVSTFAVQANCIVNGAIFMALPASEVILERNATFDYEGKYLGKGNIEVTPAD